MSESVRLLVVADDLTGANDTAVSFASAGYPTLLLMDPGAMKTLDIGESEVFSVSTDSRAIGEAARLRTADTVRSAVDRGMHRLYLKIDSTMRGSVAQQVAGAVDAWSARYPDAVAVVCSAYPAMGRTISGGVLQVNGVDVDRTPSGRDPVCPVTTPRLTELLPDAAVLANPGDARLLAEEIRTAGTRQVAVDAVTTEELVVIAEAIDLLGNAAIPVGSAGLSQAVTPLLPLPAGEPPPDPLPVQGRALVVVTSVHDTSQEQVDRYIGCEEGGDAIVVSPHPAQLLTASALPALIHQMRALLSSGNSTVIVRANPAHVEPPGDRSEIARTFAHQLASLAFTALSEETFGALVLFGGDGAEATLGALGIKRLRIVRSVAEGVPVGTVLGTAWEGLPVITKSGGFGDPELLTEIMQQLYLETKEQ